MSAVGNKVLMVHENLEFDSASYAVSIVAGLGVNGLVCWKLHGKTLKQNEVDKAKNSDEEKAAD